MPRSSTPDPPAAEPSRPEPVPDRPSKPVAVRIFDDLCRCFLVLVIGAVVIATFAESGAVVGFLLLQCLFLALILLQLRLHR